MRNLLLCLFFVLCTACANQVVTPPPAPPPTALPTASPAAPTSAPNTAASSPTQPAALAATNTPDARPTIDTPDWFNNAVVYEIFPRSYNDSNGDGIGDLNGITQKLDYIQSLGADTLWLTPIYPSPSYHGYDVTDYFKVNPEFGTEEDFKNLTAEAHKRNMRVIVDYVANHSSNQHPFFKDAYKNPASPYSDYYLFNNADHSSYQTFADVLEMPKWNHDNPAVNKYLTDAALYWLDLGADGLRADAASNVDPSFWQELRAAVKAKHPDALLLGEVWNSNALTLREAFNSGFDALFDFPWYLTLAGDFAKNGDGVLNGANSPKLLNTPYLAIERIYPHGAQVVNFPSNHDTNRVASDANGDQRRMESAALLAFVSPGAPMIYYGEEIGMRGSKGEDFDDRYVREPMEWAREDAGAGMPTWFKPANTNNQPNDGVSVEEEDAKPDSLLNYYRTLGQLRRAHPRS